MKLEEKILEKQLKKDKEIPTNPNTIREKYLFVNDISQVAHLKILEHNTWYEGSGDALLNFYRGNVNIRYMYEPFFDENKRSYFWSVSATETDFERIHVPLYRDIIDTISSLITSPKITSNLATTQVQLAKIVKDNNFTLQLKQLALPLTLVEGWGCWKIDWDLSTSTTPIIQYYRAENVDFTYKYKTKLVGVTYKDYYIKSGKSYVLIENRELNANSLIVSKNLYELDRDNNIALLSPTEIMGLFPNLNLTGYTISNFPYLLSVPSVFFEDTSNIGYGRSIMEGKLDLFDALDQAVSMSGMACRVSTPKEYFNTEFLERDNQGLPKAPKTFQRQYVLFKGGRDGSGSPMSSEPVQTTQPNVNYEGYMEYAQDLSLHIMQGLVSPATLGIDVSKKDNANAQREKEKVTVFTRESIISILSKQIVSLFSQCLCVNEYLLSVQEMEKMKTSKMDKKGLHPSYPSYSSPSSPLPLITTKTYDVHCEFEEFADVSFENKATVYGNMLSVDAITPELYVEQLWRDGISKEEKAKQVEYIKAQKEKNDTLGMGDMFSPSESEDDVDMGSPISTKLTPTSKEVSESKLTNKSFNRNNG